MNDEVLFRWFEMQYKAELMALHLRDAGIAVRVADTHSRGAYPKGTVKLFISPADMDRAMDIERELKARPGDADSAGESCGDDPTRLG